MPYFLLALKKCTPRLTQEKPGFLDCAVSQLYVLFFFLFRDRVVRTTPKNKAQLQFLISLEDKADVSMTSIFEHI